MSKIPEDLRKLYANCGKRHEWGWGARLIERIADLEEALRKIEEETYLEVSLTAEQILNINLLASDPRGVGAKSSNESSNGVSK